MTTITGMKYAHSGCNVTKIPYSGRKDIMLINNVQCDLRIQVLWPNIATTPGPVTGSNILIGTCI